MGVECEMGPVSEPCLSQAEPQNFRMMRGIRDHPTQGSHFTDEKMPPKFKWFA